MPRNPKCSKKAKDDKKEKKKKEEEKKKKVVETPKKEVEPLPRPVSVQRFTNDRGIGAQGTDVSDLQSLLVQKGYLTSSPTGYFGTLTADALRRYQTSKGLTATGELNTETRTALNGESSVLGSNITSSQAQIAALTQQLNTLLTLLAKLKAAQ